MYLFHHVKTIIISFYIYFFNEVKVKINFRLRKIHSCILKVKDVKIGEIDKFNFDTIVKL